MPPPLNEIVTLVWISAVMMLPFKRVLTILFSTSILVPTLLNLALLPGVTLGLLLASHLRSKPALALFASNSSAYISMLAVSSTIPNYFGNLFSGSWGLSIIGLLAIAFLCALLTAKAQLAFLKAIQARISLAALN